MSALDPETAVEFGNADYRELTEEACEMALFDIQNAVERLRKIAEREPFTVGCFRDDLADLATDINQIAAESPRAHL